MGINDEYVTTNQAARELGISRIRVNQLIKSGRIKAEMTAGREWMIAKTALLAFKASKTAKSVKSDTEA